MNSCPFFFLIYVEIKKGDKFRCIRDIYSGLVNQNLCFWYIKGKIYNSDLDDCITDEDGDINHRWGKNEVYRYFIPYISNKRGGYGRKSNKR